MGSEFFFRKYLKSRIIKNKYSSIYGRDTRGKKNLRERERTFFVWEKYA